MADLKLVESTPALRIEDLHVSYKTRSFQAPKSVVHGINLTIYPGEVIGFLGPNGAGKSSTIKTIMGFVLPDAGTIEVFGYPAATLEAKQRIGYLPEVALYYPFLTPMETLRLYGNLQGLGGKALRDMSYSLLERVGLKGKENAQLKTFSKGMQQRLGIAQALLGDPRLLVLDEVSSGLDPLGRRNLRELLAEIAEAGTTIFFSSHELDEVAQLCDRIILINQGRKIDEREMTSDWKNGIASPLENYFIEMIENDNKAQSEIAA
jgi:ABC-2 type transport system ATP-binding protein